MHDLEEHKPRAIAIAAASDIAVDAGLRSYMLRIYAKVALGLMLSAALAFLTANVPEVRALLFKTVDASGARGFAGLTALGGLVALAPIVLILMYESALSKPARIKSSVLYWSIAACMGAAQGVLVLAFTGASVALALLVTAIAFGGLSLLGYVVKRDLSGLGSFLAVGLIGLVLGLLANLVLRSPLIAHVTSMAGVLIFAGLIAHDTQRLKLQYNELSEDHIEAATDLGALSLYISFINLLHFLLMAFFGEHVE